MKSDTSKNPELSRIKPIIDRAEALTHEFTGDNNIWRALSSFKIEDPVERKKLHRLIKAELKKREHQKTKKAQVESKPEPWWTKHLKDAAAFEKRQPTDSYSNSESDDDESDEPAAR